MSKITVTRAEITLQFLKLTFLERWHLMAWTEELNFLQDRQFARRRAAKFLAEKSNLAGNVLIKF
jgi:hypothetical protein